MNVGFAFFRHRFAPAPFVNYILLQSLYGVVAPISILVLCGVLLTAKDGLYGNWNYMLLLFLNPVFAIVDRLVATVGMAPKWFLRYRVTSCFVCYGVMATVIITYMRKLRGWNKEHSFINQSQKPLEMVPEDLYEIEREVYKNTGLRPAARASTNGSKKLL